jgi:hypothetical protein
MPIAFSCQDTLLFVPQSPQAVQAYGVHLTCIKGMGVLLKSVLNCRYNVMCVSKQPLSRPNFIHVEEK